MAKISKAELIKLQKKFKTVRIGEEFGITRQAIHQLRKNTESNQIAGNKKNEEIIKMRDDGRV